MKGGGGVEAGSSKAEKFREIASSRSLEGQKVFFPIT